MKYTLALATIAGMALVTSASALSLSESVTAPSGNILASQLTDLGPGAQDNNRDYDNNKGPAGQTFTALSSGLLGSITIKGRGDGAGGWSTGPDPFNGTEIWGIQIASLNPVTGALTQMDSESVTGFTMSAAPTTFLTFTLANPQALTLGSQYAFTVTDLTGSAANVWYGLAHSTGDAYAGGYGFNNNISTVNDTLSPQWTYNGFAAPIPSGYDFVFAAQGVPEPATAAMLGLGGLALVIFRRRS